MTNEQIIDELSRIGASEDLVAGVSRLAEESTKWHSFTKNRASHLNDISAEERSERARKAVQARWSRS